MPVGPPKWQPRGTACLKHTICAAFFSPCTRLSPGSKPDQSNQIKSHHTKNVCKIYAENQEFPTKQQNQETEYTYNISDSQERLLTWQKCFQNSGGLDRIAIRCTLKSLIRHAAFSTENHNMLSLKRCFSTSSVYYMKDTIFLICNPLKLRVFLQN